MARETITPRTGLDPSHDVDAPPRVAQSNSLWPMMFGVVGALALGAVVFLQLDANRANMETAKLANEQAAANAEAQRLAAASTAAGPPMPAYIPVATPEPAADPQPQPLAPVT